MGTSGHDALRSIINDRFGRIIRRIIRTFVFFKYTNLESLPGWEGFFFVYRWIGDLVSINKNS